MDDRLTPVDLIGQALTNCERDFSARAGSGRVTPGEYLSDKERARYIIEHLAAHGYRVKRKPKSEVEVPS